MYFASPLPFFFFPPSKKIAVTGSQIHSKCRFSILLLWSVPSALQVFYFCFLIVNCPLHYCLLCPRSLFTHITPDELADISLVLTGHTEVCKEIAETGGCVAHSTGGYNLFPILTPLTLCW